MEGSDGPIGPTPVRERVKSCYFRIKGTVSKLLRTTPSFLGLVSAMSANSTNYTQ
jgi:hypothetical protein